MSLDVLLGLQWGDEGKGKIVDAITGSYDIIADFKVAQMQDIQLNLKDISMFYILFLQEFLILMLLI